MIDWFDTLAASRALAAENASILQEQEFVVIPGSVASVGIDELSRAYDATEASATGDDIRIGSTTTMQPEAEPRLAPVASYVLDL